MTAPFLKHFKLKLTDTLFLLVEVVSSLASIFKAAHIFIFTCHVQAQQEFRLIIEKHFHFNTAEKAVQCILIPQQRPSCY